MGAIRPLTKADKVALHFSKRCVPCLFFTRKGDGCRQGDNCTHCHFCSEREVRTRRNRLQLESRKAQKLGKPFKAGCFEQPRVTFDL
eukprot:s6223_g1.t1